jgi:hypothetical protein
MALQHTRGAIVDPQTGIPTRLFFDTLTSIVDELDTVTSVTETVYQAADYGDAVSEELSAKLLAQRIELHSLVQEAADSSDKLLKRVAELELQLAMMPTQDVMQELRGLHTQLVIQLSLQPGGSDELYNFSKLHGYAIKEIASGDTTFTTKGNQLIICNNTADATVTLNTTPLHGETVHLKRRSTGGLSFTGTIDGRTDYAIVSNYYALKLVYTSYAGEWSVI